MRNVVSRASGPQGTTFPMAPSISDTDELIEKVTYVTMLTLSLRLALPAANARIFQAAGM